MQISEINVIDFEKASDPANTPIDKVNKLLQRIGISDYGVIINKPFDEKIYELLIDTYMNQVFTGAMENKILDYVIKIYQKRGVQAKKLPPQTEGLGHKQKFADIPCPGCGDPDCDHKQEHMTEAQTTTDYLDTKQFGDYIKQHGGTDAVAVKVLSALQVFQDKSRDIFYKVEAESGYSVNGKSLDKSLIRRIVPKRIPDDVVGIWIAKNISPKGTKLKPNWSWREDPKAFTQHPDMIKLRKVVQDHIQKALTDGDVPITIQHFDQDEEMAPQFRLNIQTNEGTRCWKGYKKKGTKKMFGKTVPNCVKNEELDLPVTPADIDMGNELIKRKLPNQIEYQPNELTQAAQKKWPASPDIKKNVNTVATNIAKQQGWSGELKQAIHHDKGTGIGFAWVSNKSGIIVIKWHGDHITDVTVNKKPVRSGVIDKNIHTLKEEGPRITEQVFRRSGRMYFTTRHADEQRVNRGITDSKIETAISMLEQDLDWLIYMGMNDYQMGDGLSIFDPKSNITMVVVYKRPPLDPVTKEPTEVHPDKPQAINIMTVYHGSPITATRVPKILKRNNFSRPGGGQQILTVNQPNNKEFWHLGKGIQPGSIK